MTLDKYLKYKRDRPHTTHFNDCGCLHESLEKKITELKAHNRALVEALERISKMGAVCESFEVCDHPPCRDSCGAVLEALQALTTPPAKRAMAEAAVLKAVDRLYTVESGPDCVRVVYPDADVELGKAVEALRKLEDEG